ncbi:bridge-like lipid transfer protein family member 1 isoform X1 [Cloeon dipterum]|uniref:bridge-like lipid transfer protein family member 1 isoform X1 n=1 Tax=Cloeon dipterum TaxID=197152 RepID=UPI003220174E
MEAITTMIAFTTEEPVVSTNMTPIKIFNVDLRSPDWASIQWDTGMFLLLTSLVAATAWITFSTYFMSRIIGYILTKILNRFVKTGFMKIGSFTFNALSGKVMFRDFSYITADYSVRVQDGYVIFRWWRAYVPKDVTEDLSHSDTRLSVVLNGMEIHQYNRSQLYSRLENMFGIDPLIMKGFEEKVEEDTNLKVKPDARTSRKAPKSPGKLYTWRDLIPVVKVDVFAGRMVFGNRLVPTTLSVNIEEAHFVYSTKPAASRLDHFMHFIKCKAENFKVILVPSPKYTGMVDDPPRYMGEGFVVLSSNNVELYYYMDEPGFVPEEPMMLQLANGDIVESAPPIWGLDIKCGKGTDFSYGPWADRQRDNLFRFFFPNEYQPMKPSKPPLPGEKRVVQSFDIRLNTLNESTMDILFSKNKETNAVHINIGQGSYLEVTIPWVVKEDGYTTKVTGQLLHLEASTSLQYRSLVESETLEYKVVCHYPIHWNEHQEWSLSLTGCKATVNFIYSHIHFFKDMVNDWSSKSRPDVIHFVPYTWKILLILKDFELITISNEYNWVDCSSQNQENAHVAFCGDLFDMSFDLPFVDFLPPSLPLRFWIQGECVDMALFLPEVHSSRAIIMALDRNAKIMGRDEKKAEKIKRWRNVCQRSNGWVDCWSVPIVAISIVYIYHPMPPMGPPPQANITTPEKEEILLSPIRIPHMNKLNTFQQWPDGGQKFDPMTLEADKVSVEIEIGSSLLLLYGSVLRNFIHLKENIFGEDQTFTDMQKSKASSPPSVTNLQSGADDDGEKSFDPRDYRPLDVTVSLTLHDIQAHLVKNCGEKDPPCPVAMIERIGFEMKKGFQETTLQLLVSPAFLLSSDLVPRNIKDVHLGQGHLMLSGLQVRGHAMFSDEGISLDHDTLEYAWMIEVQLGRLTGKLSAPQLYHLITSLETFLLLALDGENCLRPPRLPRLCHHGLHPRQCPQSVDLASNNQTPGKLQQCPTSDEIKYKMTRVALDALDIYFVEASTAIHLLASPIRVSTCNLHGSQVKSGVTALLPLVQIRQFICMQNNFGTGTNRSQGSNAGGVKDGCDSWLEIGSISLGPLIVEAAMSLSSPEQSLHLVQHKFLRTHDEKTRKLWFLWLNEKEGHSVAAGKSIGKCGCIGGCVFFGQNINGPGFFKPNRLDLHDGINVASYRVNPIGADPGFGQSILHEKQLVFHTPPYTSYDIVSLQDPPSWNNTLTRSHDHSLRVPSKNRPVFERSSSISESKPSPANISINSNQSDRSLGRRFSYTPTGVKTVKDVPYTRLLDSPNLLPKLDSDSKLHNNKAALNIPETPKASSSDSKLAVEYFVPSVPPSESKHSLLSNEAEMADTLEFQRTVSISSGQSEAFYSADEDSTIVGGSVVDGKKFTSETQIAETVAKPIPRLTSYSSEQDFTSQDTKPGEPMKPRLAPLSASVPHDIISSVKYEETMSFKLSDLREKVATNKESLNRSSLNAMQKSGPNKLQDVSEVGDSSDTQSIHSTQSFISAMSSQEDLTMVNLHMQVNKPIIESPLLMSSYINHLSQMRCHRWTQSSLPLGCDAYTTPLFERTEDGKLTYIGGKYVPKFEMITEGFTTLKMLSRSQEYNHFTPPASSNKQTPTHPYMWDNATFLQSDGSGDVEEEILAFQNEHGTRTTIIVKSRGDIDIMISPLVLESLQRFIDAITPTLAALHPLTVLNDLHWNCISRVEAANILKKEQSSYLTQLQSSKRGTAERNAIGVPGPQLTLQSNVYEESIHTQTQGTIILPKVNVTLLQASIVEEIISFSALDNVRDLTCVSLFAVCFESVSAQFYSGHQAKEVVQTFHRPTVAPSGGKKISKLYKVWRGGNSPTDPSQGELVHIETSEKQQEEMVVSLNVGKCHTQLRRLKNESSILKDAYITTISQHQSKVMFTCVRLMKTELPSASKKSDDPLESDDKLGFIMFECGLEGVSLKIVKKSHFEKSENTGSEDKFPTSDPNYNESVKSKEEFDEKTQKTDDELKDADQRNSSQSKQGTPAEKMEERLEVTNKDMSNTSSCVLELKTVWFNFAAPPRAPITRKIDYTRLDWNLLSTASPGIDAWMNPSNRFALRVVCMLRTMYRRSTGIVASLMAEALDIQSIHTPAKSRYGRVTPMAKTLQEDPSCQLCNVLLKYVLQTEMIIIENNLRESDLPLLSTLRQGVIVLSRQWKNVLYTSLLLEHNYKMRNVKPLNVTFAVQDTDEENVLTDENSGEDGEVTDECTLLLKSPEKVSKSDTEQPDTDNIFHSPASPPPKKNLPPSQPPCSSRASIVFPILNNVYTSKRFENSAAFFRKDSDQTLCSDKEGMQGNSSSNNSLDGTVTLTSPKSLLPSDNEDLYSWMAKQQDYTKAAEERNRIRRNLESKVTTLSTEETVHTIESGLPNPAYNLYPMSNSLHLLDAHLIFEPLLSCLGLMPEQISGTNYERWGTNISLVGAMDVMRIDIVVSEYGKTDKKKKGKATGKMGSKFHLDIPPETPAFLCEKIGIEVDVKKMADMTVDDMIHKQNVLYISRGQLKKHTSTVINFSLNIRYISQQVNMPLLRLLHQISNMYQNFKETQMELKEQQPEGKLVKDKKNGSSSASEQQETNLDLSKSKSRQSLLQRTLSRTSIRSRKGSIDGNKDRNFPRSQSRGISPSASFRNRPQSFAQKLRSTGKSVRGYMNLSEGISPLFGTSPSGSGIEHGTISSDKSKDLNVPKCWKTVYGLLDLYATMPETKTITHRFSMAPEASEFYKASNRKSEHLPELREDVEKGINDLNGSNATPKISEVKQKELSLLTGERTRLVVFGVARIHRTRLLATLSGLKLEAEITSLHSSVTCRKKSRPASFECSITGQVGRTMIVLLEGVAPNQQTVVKVTVGKSQALYSSITRRLRDRNSGLLTVGAIIVDIPQHPVALHGMMTRGSKQLSSTLQELRVSRTSRFNRGMTIDEVDFAAPPSFPRFSRENLAPLKKADSTILQPLVMQFSVILQSLSITAALLPSLQAQYKMDQVQSTGITGSKAKFTIDLPKHSLSFTTKLQTAEANLPTAACIELPKVHVSAEYIVEGSSTDKTHFADGVILHQGSYLNASADIGVFEHSLTTDLLNHLVFVQKVFMKEVNEVLQKVYGGEKLVPLWLDENEESQPSNMKRLLFSLIVRLKRIQLTATTPTNSAVRLETGAVEFQLSNRVLNLSASKDASPSTKLFFKAQVDINLSLGQLLKNTVFEEAEPEFQQFAFFKTKIFLRNAFQDETGQGEMNDKEVVLIKLQRPLIYIQPVAVDKAILVWLNYKNAYEYWDEQRSNLQKEVLTATQQVFEKVQFSQIGTPNLGTLFLQLTVHDMGICLPLNPLPPVYGASRTYDDSRGAVVVTLDSTSISACSSGSLVSKGKFVGLCLRFAEDFETSLDEWRPDMTDVMNLCVVSEGTYEVCSRTVAQKTGSVHDNAKWFLNVQWQMEGVDIHLDVNVGKQLSALGHTLTTLTGYEEDENLNLDSDSDEGDQVDGSKASQESMYGKRLTENLPPFFFDPHIDAKTRSKLIEKEMNEQTKIINDLRTLGASIVTIEQELRKLQDLEAAAFKDFRHNMIQKLRRQSVKASSIKGKFGLGSKASALKTRSLMVPSPTPENQMETPSDDLTTNASFESSPQSGPSRSASIRAKEPIGPRVTFSPDTQNIYGSRQSSLPSMESDLSLPEYDIDPEVELRRKPSPSKYDMPDVGSNYYLEPGFSKDGGISPMSGHPSYQKSQEPNIDFELDVKVLIKSGKCVLHTKDPAKEEEIKITKMRKERSSSGATLDYPSSPSTSRKNKELKHNPSSSRLKFLNSNVTSLVDLTIFHVPGLDVKVHYESRNMNEDYSYCAREGFRKPSVKKASLFAWMTLQSIPEETIISPHILEFLEQTLEPIPSTIPQPKTNTSNTMFAMDLDTNMTSTVTNYAYTSFPVDVIVYFHMQPSSFRFSCLPVSRVECMLKLPSLDIVFSSKRAEGEHAEFADEISRPAPAPGSVSGYRGSLTEAMKIDSTSATAAVGGLSVTGCLADFSVYIFHPYGGKKSGLKEAQWSPLADSERKDSLSINVEFVKFHLSRSRKLNFSTPMPDPTLKTSLGSAKIGEHSQAVIRFSTIVDIGSASFKYDMRRLTEILAFPKAWYRRSIVRRLFLGDLSMSAVYSEGDDSPPSSFEEDSSPVSRSSASFETGRQFEDRTSRSVPVEQSPLQMRDKLRLSLESEIPKNSKLNSAGEKVTPSTSSTSPSDLKASSAWETLVLFAVNFTKLNVHMNMGNVMGNVMWQTKDFKSEGRLSIGSNGHKNMYIGVGLGGSGLDAKGGIVGGTIELSKIDTFIHIREDPGVEPDHKFGLKLFAFELRLDYMGTGVLMSRISSLDVSLRAEWKIHHQLASTSQDVPTRRPATIFMHGDLGWDQLQLMISRSTTADLLKMYHKLEEFFSQQFKSSKRVFSSLQPAAKKPSLRKKPQPKKKTSSTTGGDSGISIDARHHRHWHRPLSAVAGLRLTTLPNPLPVSGSVLGGTMELHGNNISLACFHGINFKTKSWALFSLREPCISFATEAQEVPPPTPGESMDVHVVQSLTFSLGMVGLAPAHAQHLSMATICRMSRNSLFPPQFRTLQEWFNFAFAQSELDDVDRFPSLERERTESTERRSANKSQEINHNKEVIFSLPSMQLHLKTEHLQTARTPDLAGDKPEVVCSFITEFEDHIFVTVDAEAFFFLHDLITSYLKEKDRVITSTQIIQRAKSPDGDRRRADSGRKAFDPGEMFLKDWRNFNCKTWHLEPTVRLLSWAGKSIEPYGVDYILQKLGFTHARTTIPKWMQRGFQDPLDKVLSILMLRMVGLVKDESAPPFKGRELGPKRD